MAEQDYAGILLDALDKGEINEREASQLAAEFGIPGFKAAPVAAPVPIPTQLSPEQQRIKDALAAIPEAARKGYQEGGIFGAIRGFKKEAAPYMPLRMGPMPGPGAALGLIPETKAEAAAMAAAPFALPLAGRGLSRLWATLKMAPSETLALGATAPAERPALAKITEYMKTPGVQRGAIEAVREAAAPAEAIATKRAAEQFKTGEALRAHRLEKTANQMTAETALDKKLADLAEQAAEKEGLGVSVKEPSASPGFIKKHYRGWVQSVRTTLQKQGAEGTALADSMDAVVNTSEKKAGQAISSLGKILGPLDKRELESYVTVLDENLKPINDRVAQAAADTRTLLNSSYKEARAAGLKVKGKIKHYFPHYLPIEGKEAQERAIQALLDSGRATTRTKAQELLTTYIRQHRERVFPSIEKSRTLNLPGYERDPHAVLSRYFEKLYRRIAEVEYLGASDEKALKLIDKMQAAGKDSDFAAAALRRFTSTDPTSYAQDTYQALKSYQVITKLGLAQISNATQTLNTLARTNVAATLGALRRAIFSTAEAKENAARAGGILKSSYNQLMREVGAAPGSMGEKFLKGTGFSWVERWNRIIAQNAGEIYAEGRLAAVKAGRNVAENTRKLTELGIDATKAIKAGLTEENLADAGRRVVADSQFKGGALDLPLFWTSPEGKVITQFKTFQYQQTKFVYDSIFKEAARGNLKPAASFLAFGAAVGYPVDLLKHQLTGRAMPDTALGTLASAYAAIGGIGILADTLRVASAGISGTGARFLTGPTVATVGEALEAAATPKKVLPWASRQVPIAGPLLERLVRGTAWKK